MTRARELLKGTLDLLVMRTLAIEPMYGWGIAERLREMSADAFDVNDGSLYPALQRLKSKGWVRSKWGTTENNRRARYHELTGARAWLRPQPAGRSDGLRTLPPASDSLWERHGRLSCGVS